MTIPGGHRIGIAGKTIVQSGEIRSMKFLSFLNIRLAHEVLGCADEVLPYLFDQDQKKLFNTMILSPPRGGKTTLLRDLVRQISDGSSQVDGVTVGLVDERSEIAACYQGVPQNDLGMRTDVLDGCPKAEGMEMLIRSMSPAVVAVDELGRKEDFKAVESVIHSGCKVIATAHGNSIEDVIHQPYFERLVRRRVFERYIFLDKGEHAGTILGIYDRNGRPC